MFQVRRGLRDVVQKQRCFSYGYFNIFEIPFLFKLRLTFLAITRSSSFLAIRTLENMFSWGKKLFRVASRSSKFWLNISVTHVVSQKPLNVRMGKGKGGKIGLNAFLSAGVLFFGGIFVRHGLWQKFFRYIQNRCACRLLNYSDDYYKKKAIMSYQTFKSRDYKILQRRSCSWKIWDVLSTLRRLECIQAHLLLYSCLHIFGNYTIRLPECSVYYTDNFYYTFRRYWLTKYESVVWYEDFGLWITWYLEILEEEESFTDRLDYLLDTAEEVVCVAL